MQDKNFGGWISNGFAIVFTAVQSNELLQYISLALTVISIIISISFTIWKWYVQANADGKITPEEIEDLQNQLAQYKKKEEEEKK